MKICLTFYSRMFMFYQSKTICFRQIKHGKQRKAAVPRIYGSKIF